jgi:hypothetical protein
MRSTSGASAAQVLLALVIVGVATAVVIVALQRVW